MGTHGPAGTPGMFAWMDDRNAADDATAVTLAGKLDKSEASSTYVPILKTFYLSRFLTAGQMPNDPAVEVGPAWDAAMAACVTAVNSRLVIDGTFYTGRALQTTGGCRAQLPLPTRSVASGPKLVIEIVGATRSGFIMGPAQTAKQSYGSLIQSTLTGQTYTTGVPSVVGGPAAPTTDLFGFSNIMLVWRDVAIRTPENPSLTALDCQYLSAVMVDGYTADVDAPLGNTVGGLGGTLAQPTSFHAGGLLMPLQGNNVRCTANNVAVFGYYVGVTVSEHCDMGNIIVMRNIIGQGLTMRNGAHGARVGYVSSEYNAYHVAPWSPTTGLAFIGGRVSVTWDRVDIEDGASADWSATIAHIYDVDGSLVGEFGHRAPGGATGKITVNGGTVLNYFNKFRDTLTPVWGPAELSGLALDLDADDITGADGSAVATWPRKGTVGSDAVQATGANQPTLRLTGFQGGKSVEFGGTQIMATSNISTGGHTVFAIVQASTQNDPAVIIEEGVNTGATVDGFVLTQSLHMIARTGNVSARSFINLDIGKPTILSGSHDGTFAGNRITRYGLRPPQPLAFVSGAANLGTPINTAPIYVGARAGGTIGFVGQIKRLIVFNRALTLNEHDRVMIYLARKYSLLALDLPVAR